MIPIGFHNIVAAWLVFLKDFDVQAMSGHPAVLGPYPYHCMWEQCVSWTSLSSDNIIGA